jgi:hypothetical protein
VPLARQVYDAVFVGVPTANGLCPTDGCPRPVTVAWTLVYLALLALSGWLAARALTGGDRVRQAGRLALVVAAGLAILLYARSTAGAAHPLGSARYLHMLPVSLPAVLWPLWSAAGRLRPGMVLFAAFATAMLVSTVAHATRIPQVAAEDRDTRALIAALDRLGVTRVYADYPICNQLSFRTRERIVCAVVADDGRRGMDRYQPFRKLVDADPHPAYVVAAGAAPRAALPAQVTEVAGYRIYRTSSQRS